MNKENEITLRIKGSLENLKRDLYKKGYNEIEHFILYDIFMIPKSLEIEKLSIREIIANSIIIRKVKDMTKKEIRRDIVNKIKNINKKGEILEQKNIILKILNCKEAQSFLESIGYKKIMEIIEEDISYKKEDFIITSKDIKNGDNLIEVETISNSNFNTINKLKEKLKEENLYLDFEDCFVKKAEVELEKILRR